MRKGIFWCKQYDSSLPELVTVSVACDPNGSALEPAAFSSKSGDNFNHEIEWSRLNKEITEGREYSFYPRGRVEIQNGKARIFLAPDLNRERILCKIMDFFELTNTDGLKSVRIISDGSRHYRHAYFMKQLNENFEEGEHE